tara:strand:- start:428 stop:1384 length:957 start_codon:yes stop_codon:yes gene_type:complete
MSFKLKKKNIKVGIIGFGNIGQKRFKALSMIKKFHIDVVYIVDFHKPKNLNKNIKYFKNWKDIKSIKVDLVIVSTPTSESKIIVKNLCNKFNIIVEKPLSNKINQIKKIIHKSNQNKKMLKIGYNLRFDDGLLKAKKLIDQNLLGKIYYIKIFYANGAAKTNSNNVGSLLDMGTHSLNLLIWITKIKNFKIIKAISQKNEFLKKTKIDNGFILLKAKNIHSIIHHGFCTWKNNFYLEIIGSKGLIRINSLSKWKDQKVTFGIRKLPDGKPDNKQWYFKKDNSWKNELMFVFNAINNKKNYKKINLEGIETINIIKKLI